MDQNPTVTFTGVLSFEEKSSSAISAPWAFKWQHQKVCLDRPTKMQELGKTCLR